MARHELWVELADTPGNLAALAGDLAACGANIVHLDVHAGPGATVIDRLVVEMPDARSHELAAVADRCGATLRQLDGAGQPAVTAGVRRPGVWRAPRHTPSPPRPGADLPRRRPPMTLERLVALSDGGLVRLRHLSRGDRDELVAHHRRCSEATRRHSRFLAPGALPSPTAVGDPPAPDGGDHVALAGLIGGDIVGAARYDVDTGGAVANVAVIVEDRHQRRGIGALLVNELAVLAANADVQRLRAIAPTGGEVLPRTLRRAGLAFTARRDGEAVVLDCGLPDGLSASA